MFPILLVHGIDDTGARFAKMQTALRAQGFESVHAMNIIPPDASISFATMGEQIRDSVAELLQQTGASKVDIVAYSMGALAVRHFLQRLEGRLSVRRFISLAAPHHGTLTAYLRQNAGTREMRPGSSFLHNLNDRDNPLGDVKLYSFWTPMDLMVLPRSSCRLEDAHNRAFRVLFHPWMTSDQRVIDAVAQTLAGVD